MYDDIRKKLMDCLDRNGIDLSSEEIEIESISFVTAIVDIEQEFGIEFPDEYLVMDSMSSFDRLYEIVSLAIEMKSKELAE